MTSVVGLAIAARARPSPVRSVTDLPHAPLAGEGPHPVHRRTALKETDNTLGARAKPMSAARRYVNCPNEGRVDGCGP